MSKRVRGTVRSHRRPGARPPSERPSGRRHEIGAERPSQLESGAQVAEAVVEDRPVEARAEMDHPARRITRTHHKIKAGSLLAARAATEYVYVSQDMRRILVVASGLIGLLFTLWLMVVVLRIIPLPFY